MKPIETILEDTWVILSDGAGHAIGAKDSKDGLFYEYRLALGDKFFATSPDLITAAQPKFWMKLPEIPNLKE